MIQQFLKKACATALCLLFLTGCSAASEGTAPPQAATASEGDQLIDSADLIGSVTSVEAGQLTVQPAEMDGDIAMQAADGHEDASTATIVQLRSDCTFEHAAIDVASGDVTATHATATDVQRQSDVAVFGDMQADGSILASRVVIVRYSGATGAGGAAS